MVIKFFLNLGLRKKYYLDFRKFGFMILTRKNTFLIFWLENQILQFWWKTYFNGKYEIKVLTGNSLKLNFTILRKI